MTRYFVGQGNVFTTPPTPHQRAKEKRLKLKLAGRKGVWWAPAINRWHDQTGVAHVVYEGGSLCGANPYSTGGSYRSVAETGAKACRRCQKIIDEVFSHEGE